MDILKALKNTTIISGVALLALGATEAQAVDTVDAVGHISASLQGTLAVTEVRAINFGNFSIACTGGGGSDCTGGATIALSDQGTRVAAAGGADAFTLLHGAGGVTNGTNLETGAQTPGLFTIANTDSVSTIYVSFSNSAGAIIDTNHANNYATIAGGTGGTQTFKVASFTFESDSSGAAGPSGSGYTQAAASGSDVYGRNINCGASCTIRVGATLTSTAQAGGYGVGRYQGTYNIMVSY